VNCYKKIRRQTMIRFFGIILGFVLMINIAFSVGQSDYGFSSLTTFGREAWRVVVEKVHGFAEGDNVILTTVDDNDGGADILVFNDQLPLDPDPAVEPAAVEPSADDMVGQVLENPSEIRIFWGPFSTRRAAGGFAQMAESITGLPTEIIEKNMDRLYVAFIGEPAAIDSALASFAHATGMNLNPESVL
jgi:hypothetical protein